jgi:uncharacterized protein
MFGKLIPKLIFAGALLASSAARAAEPSVDQIYQAAKAGNYTQAQSMMDQVLRDHPDSAKAHFIQAELFAKEGKLNAARGEFQKAQQIDPNLSFAKPAAVQELKSVLSGGNRAGGRPVQANGGVHVPWGPLLGGLAVLLVILMIIRSRSQRVVVEPGPAAGWRPAGPAGPGGPVMPGGGYGPGYGAPPAAGGMGSGILGGLATGAAVGAGMVAGEALMHKVMGGGGQQMPVDTNDGFVQNDPGANYDMGGNDFGVNDAGSWDDSSGGSSWDSGGGGSDDDWS